MYKRQINNVGDIVFESDHTAGNFTYNSATTTITKNLAEGHLHFTTPTTDRDSSGPWTKRKSEDTQLVIRTLEGDETEKKLFPIDFFKNSASLTDLEVSVTVNGIKKIITSDFTLVNGTSNKYISFVKDLEIGDQIKITGSSSATKVAGKGIYQVPRSLEVNAENTTLGTFTYGQIHTHVQDIFERNEDLTGAVIGNANFRDKPDARLKGGTILQHEAPLLPAVFGLIDQTSNVLSLIHI